MNDETPWHRGLRAVLESPWRRRPNAERVDPGPEQGPECGCHPLNRMTDEAEERSAES